jgi:hypothetical protein
MKHSEPRRFWTPAEMRLVRKYFPWIPTQEIADELGRTVLAVYQMATKLGVRKEEEAFADACRWRSPREACARNWFRKGHTTWNKGRKMPKGWSLGRMKETQFRKGQKGWNWMPVGATRLIDGYLFRKVSDVAKVPYYVNWKAEHHLVWRKATGHRRVPRGHALVFKDGNRMNITPRNLELITRKELRARNNIHALPEELKEVIRLKGAINRQITYQSRRQHGKEQVKRPA